ncbi:phosphoglycolate phosphatase [Vibrio sp.]|nr:phosphoglycolate phosphatase [Vibrio sp.]
MENTVNKEIKLVIFDLDGTLLDSVPDLAMAANQTVQALGYPAVSECQVRDYVGNGADVLIGRSLSHSLNIDPSLTPEIRHQARTMFDQYYEQTGHQLSHLYPNVERTLDALKNAGYVLTIVTNKPSQFVPHILQQHNIDRCFSDALGGDAFPEKKPNPVALNWLMEKYNVSPEQTIMVGDSKNDILAARNAQCVSFGLTYGYNHGEPISASNPDYIADDIAKLLDILGVSGEKS